MNLRQLMTVLIVPAMLLLVAPNLVGVQASPGEAPKRLPSGQ